MNTPQAQRLLRSRERLVAGVAGGLARYFNVDPVIVRLIFVLLGLMNGMGVVLYLVLWLLMPNEDAGEPGNNLEVAFAEMRALVERLVDEVRALFRR
ncbi:PspC domain-containing protein [Chloroflexus sp.]|uniref:PspC domain-containing protein n=1 Tax=Chloroflexus sp. TaxID=1904827 RepID=UPI00261CC234|nr:PspC domain-containing protein [uncultured Chloroflexus sp.]